MAQQFYLLLGRCEGASQSLQHTWAQEIVARIKNAE